MIDELILQRLLLMLGVVLSLPLRIDLQSLVVLIGYKYFKPKSFVSEMLPWLSQTYGAERMSYVFFGLSQVLFPIAFLYANDNRIHTIETSLIRGIVSIILNLAIIRYYGMPLDYKYDTNFYNISKRNVIVVIHGLAITAAQFYLPLPIVHTINFFSPIFIFVIDYFENGVKINKTQIYFLLLSVFGVLCTINSELVSTLLDDKYQMQTDFKNYIKLTPGQLSLYGLGLIGIMFLWAYGILRVRTYYKNNHVYVNFNLGLLFTITSGFLYPHQVQKKTDFKILFISVFLTGIPLVLGQLFSVAALALNKKTGQIVVLSGIPVLIGYLISYFRYQETIESLELIGSLMITIGLIGVIRCGDDPNQENANKLVGEQQQKKIQDVYYSFLSMG